MLTLITISLSLTSELLPLLHLHTHTHTHTHTTVTIIPLLPFKTSDIIYPYYVLQSMYALRHHNKQY